MAAPVQSKLKMKPAAAKHEKVHYTHALLSHLTLLVLSEPDVDQQEDFLIEGMLEDEIYRIINIEHGRKLRGQGGSSNLFFQNQFYYLSR